MTSSRRDRLCDHLCRIAWVTLLNCLTAAVPARERVITCEEVFELRKTPYGDQPAASTARIVELVM